MQTEIDYTTALNAPDWTGRWFLPSRYYSFRKTFTAEDGTTDVHVDFVVADTSMLLNVGTGSNSFTRAKQWEWLAGSASALVTFICVLCTLRTQISHHYATLRSYRRRRWRSRQRLHTTSLVRKRISSSGNVSHRL
jgi:hypothetical protein